MVKEGYTLGTENFQGNSKEYQCSQHKLVLITGLVVDNRVVTFFLICKKIKWLYISLESSFPKENVIECCKSLIK